MFCILHTVNTEHVAHLYASQNMVFYDQNMLMQRGQPLGCTEVASLL